MFLKYDFLFTYNHQETKLQILRKESSNIPIPVFYSRTFYIQFLGNL